MENKINIAQLLKDCPKGMELDCTMYDNVTLIQVREDNIYPIKIETPDGSTVLTKYGGVSYNKLSKCIIFPKGETNWEGFHKPFKDGDIVVTKTSNNFIFYSIYKGVENRKVLTYVDYYLDGNRLIFNDNLCSLCLVDEIVEQKLATEEEKQKLFDAIKSHGYKWNEETKTLEKLVKPKFKVGDRIKSIISSSYYTVVDIKNDQYFIKSDTDKYPYQVPFSNEINYKLVPNKFDINTLVPFESKVLVRDSTCSIWRPSIFGYIDKSDCGPGHYYVLGGICWRYCIPYEGNEHLLGTTNECNEYFKNW